MFRAGTGRRCADSPYTGCPCGPHSWTSAILAYRTSTSPGFEGVVERANMNPAAQILVICTIYGCGVPLTHPGQAPVWYSMAALPRRQVASKFVRTDKLPAPAGSPCEYNGICRVMYAIMLLRLAVYGPAIPDSAQLVIVPSTRSWRAWSPSVRGSRIAPSVCMRATDNRFGQPIDDARCNPDHLLNEHTLAKLTR